MANMNKVKFVRDFSNLASPKQTPKNAAFNIKIVQIKGSNPQTEESKNDEDWKVKSIKSKVDQNPDLKAESRNDPIASKKEEILSNWDEESLSSTWQFEDTWD